MISYFSISKMNQFKPNIKIDLLVSSILVSSLIPRNKAKEVAYEKETEGKGRRKRESIEKQEESECKERVRREEDKTKMSGLCRKQPLGEGKPSLWTEK